MATPAYQFGTVDLHGRLPFVDYAKGLCILLVVMMHSTLGLGEAVHAQGWLHEVVAFAKPFRMPDFFLVSGLFLARTIDRDWPTYIDRKVVHFLYFYLLWFAIQSLFRVPGLLAGGDVVPLLRHLGIGLIDPFGTLWFIYILPVFFVVTKLLRRAPTVLVLAAAAALEIAHLQSDWMVPHEFARRYVYFYIGYRFAGEIFAFAGEVARRPAAALIALILWVNLNGLLVWSGRADLPFVSFALGLAGAAAIVALASLMATFDLFGFLRLMGRHSLPIYLAFFLPMVVTRIVLVKTGLLGLDVGTASALITFMGIVVPLALYLLTRGTWLYWLFERPAWARMPAANKRLAAAE